MKLDEILEKHNHKLPAFVSLAVDAANIKAIEWREIPAEEARRRFELEDSGGPLIGVGGHWVSTPAQSGGFFQSWAGFQFPDGSIIQTSRRDGCGDWNNIPAVERRFRKAFDTDEATWYAPVES